MVRFGVLLMADSAVWLGLWAARLTLLPMILQPARLEQLFPVGLTRLPALVAVLVALLVTGNYGSGDARRDPRRLFLASALGAGLALSDRLWTEGLGITLPMLAGATTLLWLVLFLERMTVNRTLRAIGFRRPHALRTVFVGPYPECRAAAAGAAFRTADEYHLVGIVDSSEPASRDALGSLSELPDVLLTQRAEAVVVCGYLENHEFQALVEVAHDAGCQLLSIPRSLRITGVEPRLVWRSGQPLIELTSPALRGRELVLKRLGDIVGALIGLLVLAPVFAVLALAVRLDSPGPIFYCSPRWGRLGREIGIWKFRTMVHGAADLLTSDPELRATFHSNIKIVNDPRVTRVGRFLRRWSLDELPQVVNVLFGDMSFVGPRPKLLGEEQRYGAAMETVLSVRPGLTGLWQISGRNATTYEERIAMDVKYATHPSLWSDVRILLHTIPVVVKGTGAH